MIMIKRLSLSVLLLASAAATSASSQTAPAEGHLFGPEAGTQSNGYVEFNRVDAPAEGVIEVYEYSRASGEMGALLATEAVGAGTTWDVSIIVGPRRNREVVAVLKVDGQVLDQMVFGDLG
jgi:hypothetical protein